jgi:acyl-CoA thioesterase I
MSDPVESPSRSRWSRLAGAVLPRLAFYPFLAASLLVFPSMLPGMILGWLILFVVRRFRGKVGWHPLAFALGILVIKRVAWAPGLVVLALLMIAASALDAVQQKRPGWKTAAWVAAACLAPAWVAMAWSWSFVGQTSRKPVFLADRPIVCIGDSLSAMGFPRVLEKRLRVPVIDAALGGITSAEGLQRLPEALAQKPQAVVIELGGHDYLRGKSRQDTWANLEGMIRASRSAGAEVFLFEIPRGFVTDPFAGLERGLAREYDLELITDGAIRQLVLFSPFTPLGEWTGRHLSDDGLHPNDAGHRFLADRVESALRRVYGDGILR